MTNQFFPSYTIGADAYDAVPGICGEYGKTAVIIGGEKSRAAAEPAIRKACEGQIEILGSFQYGENSGFGPAKALTEIPEVTQADMIFAVGGGRAIDTAKIAAEYMHKPVFSFPTLCSNCAPVTAVCVAYHEDGSFQQVWYRTRPAYHTFINTEVIIHSPRDYFWAGIGDALSKQYEVLFSIRGDEYVPYIRSLGAQMAGNCSDELIRYGVAAMEAFDRKEITEDFERVVQLVIVTTGLVSNCLTGDYNSSVGHAIYNGHTEVEHDQEYLHGAVVCYGTLVLLTLDKQFEARDQMLDFCRALALPHCLADVGESLSTAERLAEHASTKYDLDQSPYKVTKEMLLQAILDLEELNRKAK